MDKLKSAYRVVADASASQESWLPALAKVESSKSSPIRMDRWRNQHPAVLMLDIVFFSVFLAVLAGGFAGQSLHVSYYANHLLSSFVLQNALRFEPWSNFYAWTNHHGGPICFIPVFFAYSMTFMTQALCKKWVKGAAVASISLVAIFHILAYSGVLGNHLTASGMDASYVVLWYQLGAAGAVLAAFLGRHVARNLSELVKPDKVMFALLLGLMPFNLFMIAPLSYEHAVFHALFIPFLIGLLVPLFCRSTRLSTSLSLSLAAVSPFVLCGLLHIPIAIWFEKTLAPPGFLSVLSHAFIYWGGLPLVALFSALGGGAFSRLIALRIRHLVDPGYLSDSLIGSSFNSNCNQAISDYDAAGSTVNSEEIDPLQTTQSTALRVQALR